MLHAHVISQHAFLTIWTACICQAQKKKQKPTIKVNKGEPASPAPAQIFTTFEGMKTPQTMQNYTRQSPIELPSSSNTSKQESNSHTVTNSNSAMSNYNFQKSDVRQITQ